jgi:large subunit ribosomal protein L24
MQSTKTVTKPSRQRRMLYQAADHIRHRIFAAHFSPELRASHLVKTFPVRSGDTVRVMRGDHKGLEGKVTRIDKRKYKIYVEGLTREKVDGTTIFMPIHPSKVMITNLNLDDKWRKKILERKKLAQAKPKETQRKPKEKPRPKLEKPVVIIQTKPPAAEEKGAEEKASEEQKTEEQKPLPEKKSLAEETLAEEKRPRKKSTKTKKRTSRKATAQKAEIEIKESAKEKKPRAGKKKPKRKAVKKTEGGE